MEAPELLIQLKAWFSSNHPWITVTDSIGKLPVHSSETYRRVLMNQRRGFCFHHAAGSANIQDYAQDHIDRGWPGLAYGLMIHRGGSLEIAWPLDTRTYGQGWKDNPNIPESIGDENTQWIAVLVNGFFRSPDYGKEVGAGEPSISQLQTVLALCQFGKHPGVNLAQVTGHFEHGKPACPGTTLQTLIRAIQFNTPPPSIGISLKSLKDRQAALKLLGFDPGPVDGIMGFRTRKAIRQFQAYAGIRVDGDWGPRTTAAMVEALRNYRRESGGVT